MQAIRNVSVEIPRGRTTVITGPSGSGKTTLLSLLGLLTTPSRGELLLEGEPVLGLSDIFRTRIRREKFAFIFQARHLLPSLTCLENVMLPLLNRDLGPAEREHLAREQLKRFDLKHRAAFRVCELSGGEQQRVALARALVTHPQILFADEPGSSIESRLVKTFLTTIAKLKREDKLTVIMASHDPLIVEAGDITIPLLDGRVVASPRRRSNS